LRKSGISIVSSNSDLEGQLHELLNGKRIQYCLDIGAHHGEFIERLARLGFRLETLAIEPSTKACQILESKGFPNVKVVNCGLGKKSENRTLYESGSVFASIKKKIENFDHVESESIAIKTLDDVVSSFPNFKTNKAILKIDTQGSELDILQGSINSLKEIPILLVEVPLNPMYEDTFTINQIIDFMHEKGFIISGIHTPRFNGGKPSDCDVIFSKF
jgi:FkbM family methyltransferase